jgi:hypothetical protein
MVGLVGGSGLALVLTKAIMQPRSGAYFRPVTRSAEFIFRQVIPSPVVGVDEREHPLSLSRFRTP